jgi:hypothetical protein
LFFNKRFLTSKGRRIVNKIENVTRSTVKWIIDILEIRKNRSPSTVRRNRKPTRTKAIEKLFTVNIVIHRAAKK